MHVYTVPVYLLVSTIDNCTVENLDPICLGVYEYKLCSHTPKHTVNDQDSKMRHISSTEKPSSWRVQ